MNRYTASRPIVLSLVRVLLVQLTSLPALHGAPIVSVRATGHKHMPEGMAPDDPHLWIYLGIAVVLVLMGGAFAGLTIALMGQDEIYLQVIESSGEDGERKNAHSVLKLLKRGKHWVLVTLLLSNVITNETLPIILDRSLGGGWPAVLSSTVLIVIFGEVVPQSVCVRYGLPIGAWMAPFVLALMYILGPVAWPTAKLLDWILGEDHGTVYKKAGLKTLVTLHKTLGSTPADRLNQDEVTIISAVLDLKEKSVGSIMTPMEDVFTMSTETILDEKTMDIILSAGYSRIPIHTPDNPENFVGMLLVKILITYDPEDAKRVGDFALATLPETRPETSCLDIVNFFQEGKSHMVLVSEYPAEDHGALGVVTLEDVIEELIGEEIIDESDVFIDVHKAIRRLNPAPKARVPKGEVVTDIENSQATQEEADLMDISENTNGTPKSSIDERSAAIQERVRKLSRQQLSSLSTSPKFSIMRRSSSSAGVPSLNLRLNDPQMREHLKHIGPSNLASKPKGTRYSTVKIKPAGTESKSCRGSGLRQNSVPVSEPEWSPSKALQRAETVGLLDSAGREATAEVEQAQSVYGTMDRPQAGRSKTTEGNIEVTHDSQISQKSNKTGMSPESTHRPQTLRRNSSGSHSTLGSLPRKYHSHSSGHTPKGTVRTGSITENIVDVGGGVKKIVLDLTSSSEDADEDHANGDDHNDPAHAVEGSENDSVHDNEPHSSHKKTRRRKRKKARSHHDQAKTLLD